MKRCILILLSVLLCLFSGCSNEREYQLGQVYENIQTIEVLYVAPYQIHSNQDLLQMEADACVDQPKWGDFINEFGNISCYAYFNDPSWSVSEYVLRITYEDGSVDLICARGGLYYSADDWKYRYLYFDEDEFNALISNFST